MLTPNDATYVLGIFTLAALMLILGEFCYAFTLFSLAFIMWQVLER